MKYHRLVAVVAGAGALGLLCAASNAGTGAYTAAQSKAGAKIYAAKCSLCHGAQLQGVSAPALRGAGSGLAGDTVAEAYRFISTQMPAGNPGSLSQTDYAAVVAYVLSRNGHAPGPHALTASSAKSSKERF